MNPITSSYLKSPEEMPHAFARAWNDRDAEQLASFFSENAEFVNVVGLWWHDRQSIWKAHEYGLRVIFSNSDLSVGRVTVKAIGENAAIVHARMSLAGQTPLKGNSTPGKRQNIFSFVMAKKKEGWQCVSAHNTDVVPGKETNLVDEGGHIQPVDYR